MAGMPGLISDQDGSSYSQLSAAMHAFTEMYGPLHSANVFFVFFFLCATAIPKKKMRENVLDLLNKENSLSLRQGLHPGTKSLGPMEERRSAPSAEKTQTVEDRRPCKPWCQLDQ